MKKLYIKTYGCQMNVYDTVRMQSSFTLFFAISIFVFLLAIPSISYSEDVLAIIRKCSPENFSHVDASNCLEEKLKNSENELSKQKRKLSENINNLPEEQEDVYRLQKSFSAWLSTSDKYRDNKCGFYNALAMDGNGAGDLQMACMIKINSEATEEMKWISNKFLNAKQK